MIEKTRRSYVANGYLIGGKHFLGQVWMVTTRAFFLSVIQACIGNDETIFTCLFWNCSERDDVLPVSS